MALKKHLSVSTRKACARLGVNSEKAFHLAGRWIFSRKDLATVRVVNYSRLPKWRNIPSGEKSNVATLSHFYSSPKVVHQPSPHQYLIDTGSSPELKLCFSYKWQRATKAPKASSAPASNSSAAASLYLLETKLKTVKTFEKLFKREKNSTKELRWAQAKFWVRAHLSKTTSSTMV